MLQFFRCRLDCHGVVLVLNECRGIATLLCYLHSYMLTVRLPDRYDGEKQTHRKHCMNRLFGWSAGGCSGGKLTNWRENRWHTDSNNWTNRTTVQYEHVASDRKAGTWTVGQRQTLTETGSLLSLKAWKLKLRGCWVAFLMGTRLPEHSRCSGMPSISCGEFHKTGWRSRVAR